MTQGLQAGLHRSPVSRACYAWLAVAAAALLPPAAIGAVATAEGDAIVLALVAPHIAGLLAALAGLALLRTWPRRTGVTAAALGGLGIAWSLFMGVMSPEAWPVLLGPPLLLAAGVIVLRQNPKGQSSPLPSLEQDAG